MTAVLPCKYILFDPRIDPIFINFPYRTFPGMKSVLHKLHIKDAYIRRKTPVHFFRKQSRIHFSRQNNARSLAACMNSGIGSPGAVDLHLISYAVFQRLFQNPLYRPICI